jgi:hypothetical protein
VAGKAACTDREASVDGLADSGGSSKTTTVAFSFFFFSAFDFSEFEVILNFNGVYIWVQK